MTRPPFEEGEWYHCFTRGVDKRKTFLTTKDYERFQELLYLSNAQETTHRSDLLQVLRNDIFKRERATLLVDIGAYALMPNHFHILIRERSEGSISSFMRRIGTAYTMYFNIKNERVGNLFVKPFRSKHITDDRHLRQAFSYVSINARSLAPASRRSSLNQADFLTEYRFSNYPDYMKGNERAESTIITSEAKDLLDTYFTSPSVMVREAQEYENQL